MIITKKIKEDKNTTIYHVKTLYFYLIFGLFFIAQFLMVVFEMFSQIKSNKFSFPIFSFLFFFLFFFVFLIIAIIEFGPMIIAQFKVIIGQASLKFKWIKPFVLAEYEIVKIK